MRLIESIRFVAGWMGLVFVEELHGNPVPINLRPKQQTDKSPTPTEHADNSNTFFTDSGQAFVITDNGDYLNKRYNIGRQLNFDSFDEAAIDEHNKTCLQYERIGEDNYRLVKPVWAKVKQYRKAANHPDLKGKSGLGQRKLATYYKVLNQAQEARNRVGGEAPPPQSTPA